MLETYTALFTDISRNLWKNARESPFLYFFFGFMMFFSILGMAYISLFLIRTGTVIDLYDVFLIVFFISVMKSGVDFHKHFVKSNVLSYSLSTPIKHSNTAFDVFLIVFWAQLGLWALISILFSIFIALGGINLAYPIEYIQFTMGAILGAIIGTVISINFFSSKRYRLVPVPFLIAGLYFFHDPISTLFIIFLSILYLIWSLTNALDSYQFVNRKERKNERDQVKINKVLKAIFYKETTQLWRDKLLFSFIITAVTVGAFSGYLAAFGDESLIPEGLRQLTQYISPVMYAFLGVYVLTIYTAVFPSLNFFLAEENTIWIIRNLPVKEKTIVNGKVLALTLPFISSIPFIAFFSAFTGLDMIISSLWILVFAFLMGITISFPLGVKYMGKKSDILLLYSVAIILFMIIGFALAFENLIGQSFFFSAAFYIISILIAFGLMLISLDVSSKKLALNYRS